MSNFTISWKLEISRKAGRSWKLELKQGKLEPYGELEKFVKFYTSWKFTQVKYMYKYSTSWKLDKLESLTARQAGNFKIIKFIFINKFLFLFNFKNKLFEKILNLCYNKRGNININIYIINLFKCQAGNF